IGENLSYPEERILVGKAKDFTADSFEDLAVILIQNKAVAECKVMGVTHGIADACFIRGKVPMTKEEVRTVCVAKMALVNTDIVYD
ncbi:MAG: bifunctional cobalt-precorrin-7 (C(5))-methyltransferase/cobalt-precorrin-6B (C(15))-methyltransferase, partial [Niameybacter sp.]